MEQLPLFNPAINRNLFNVVSSTGVVHYATGDILLRFVYPVCHGKDWAKPWHRAAGRVTCKNCLRSVWRYYDL